MSLAACCLAALAVLPADRLAMADRLFNRGKYAEAEVEYIALAASTNIAPDEMLFRLAEVDRAVGRKDAARKRYSELALNYPSSSHAAASRFFYAMGANGADKIALLKALDSERVDVSTRAAALYNLGLETGESTWFARCLDLEPKGTYADYARIRLGSKLAASASRTEQRKGLELLLNVAFGKSPLAEEALYLASLQSYRTKNYGEASTLFRRYGRNHPQGPHAEEAETMAIWCDYQSGRIADAAAACGSRAGDDFAYIRACCASASGDRAKALSLFKAYLADYPNGKYRADAELPIARLEFELARDAADPSRTIESAKRSFALSKLAADELRLAWAYEKAGREEEALSEYASIARQFPQTEEAADALYRRALVEVRRGAWNAAEFALAEALATGKGARNRPLMLYWRGVAATKIDHEAEGIKFLQEALAGELPLEERREAKLMIADLDWKAGRVDSATRAYRELVNEGACSRMTASHILSVGHLIGGAEAKICAQALVKLDSAEWRQAGWALLGETEEKSESLTAAMTAYRACLAEGVVTESAAPTALALGLLEMRAGEREAADATLKKAVSLGGTDARLRARAYLALAQNAEARGDASTACAYATVITSLFDDAALVGEAKKILAAHPEVTP